METLRARPLQCHRCLEKGHVQRNCTNAIDRRGACYNCGAPGHKASGCTAKTRCVPCAETGAPSNHRVGSDNCHPRKKKGKSSNGSGNKEQTKIAMGEKEEKSPSPTETQEKKSEPPKPQRKPRIRGAPLKERAAAVSAKVAPALPEPMREVVMEEA